MEKDSFILIACEESGTVTEEFVKLGYQNVFSADIIPTSGKYPGRHILGDVIPLLDGNCSFNTEDGCEHVLLGKWDMIIAFPPCTYLTNAGTRHYSIRMNPVEKVEERKKERKKAAEFFMQFVNADCDRIAIENPVGYMNGTYRKPDQIIHLYFFATGSDDQENYHQKRTCLWLKNLPKLKRINDLIKPEPVYICQGNLSKGKKIGWCEGIKNTTGGQEGRAKARSKTFKGIAENMATQWTQEGESK